MATGSQVRLGKWFEEFRAENVAHGIEQGMQQERARWLARLRRHAAIKFGAQTAEQMERVGDWIVECDHREDLLARVSAMRADGGDGN